MSANKVEATLASIRSRLTRLPPELTTSLRPPADVDARGNLAKLVCAAPTLPEDLDAWFRCHDGQEFLAKGIDPDAVWTWLSIEDAIKAWQFLGDENEEILQPWSKDWLPIAQNGGGDYIVYVLRGKNAGKLLSYYHDDEARPVEAPSLDAFAKRIDKRLGETEKSLKQKSGYPSQVSDEGSIWQDVDAPTLDEIKAAPIGAAFHRRSLPYQSYWYQVYVKLAKGTWIMGRAQSPPPHHDDDYRLSDALSDIERRLKEALPRDWKETDDKVVQALCDDKIYPSGLTALGGKPSRGDPYFIRRRGSVRLR